MSPRSFARYRRNPREPSREPCIKDNNSNFRTNSSLRRNEVYSNNNGELNLCDELFQELEDAHIEQDEEERVAYLYRKGSNEDQSPKERSPGLPPLVKPGGTMKNLFV